MGLLLEASRFEKSDLLKLGRMSLTWSKTMCSFFFFPMQTGYRGVFTHSRNSVEL